MKEFSELQKQSISFSTALLEKMDALLYRQRNTIRMSIHIRKGALQTR